MPKLKNKDGTNTQYAFLCGYVEVYGDVGDHERATISREANGYHVKGFDSNGIHFWEVIEKVKDARKFAKKKAGKFKK